METTLPTPIAPDHEVPPAVARAPDVRPDARTVLQSLWLFALLNYLYCDVLTLMHAEDLRGFLAGSVGGMEITGTFLFVAGVLMEVPIAMVLVSRVAGHRTARAANLVAGVIMTLAQAGSFLLGTSPAAFYVFFSIIEIATTLAVIRFAWRWRSA